MKIFTMSVLFLCLEAAHNSSDQPGTSNPGGNLSAFQDVFAAPPPGAVPAFASSALPASNTHQNMTPYDHTVAYQSIMPYSHAIAYQNYAYQNYALALASMAALESTGNPFYGLQNPVLLPNANDPPGQIPVPEHNGLPRPIALPHPALLLLRQAELQRQILPPQPAAAQGPAIDLLSIPTMIQSSDSIQDSYSIQSSDNGFPNNPILINSHNSTDDEDNNVYMLCEDCMMFSSVYILKMTTISTSVQSDYNRARNAADSEMPPRPLDIAMISLACFNNPIRTKTKKELWEKLFMYVKEGGEGPADPELFWGTAFLAHFTGLQGAAERRFMDKLLKTLIASSDSIRGYKIDESNGISDPFFVQTILDIQDTIIKKLLLVLSQLNHLSVRIGGNQLLMGNNEANTYIQFGNFWKYPKLLSSDNSVYPRIRNSQYFSGNANSSDPYLECKENFSDVIVARSPFPEAHCIDLSIKKTLLVLIGMLRCGQHVIPIDCENWFANGFRDAFSLVNMNGRFCGISGVSEQCLFYREFIKCFRKESRADAPARSRPQNSAAEGEVITIGDDSSTSSEIVVDDVETEDALSRSRRAADEALISKIKSSIRFLEITFFCNDFQRSNELMAFARMLPLKAISVTLGPTSHSNLEKILAIHPDVRIVSLRIHEITAALEGKVDYLYDYLMARKVQNFSFSSMSGTAVVNFKRIAKLHRLIKTLFLGGIALNYEIRDLAAYCRNVQNIVLDIQPKLSQATMESSYFGSLLDLGSLCNLMLVVPREDALTRDDEISHAVQSRKIRNQRIVLGIKDECHTTRARSGRTTMCCTYYHVCELHPSRESLMVLFPSNKKASCMLAS